MKFKTSESLFLLLIVLLSQGCKHPGLEDCVRIPVDTIGFAQYDWQMDSIMERITGQYGKSIKQSFQKAGIDRSTHWKTVISPHDDYAYAGSLYPMALKHVTANTLILIGVAHKARILNLEDQIIFDGFDAWKGPYGNVPVSSLRTSIMERLPSDLYQVNDSMQAMEHSLEALIPFLQYYNPTIEIIPILVPYMNFNRMDKLARSLASAIHNTMEEEGKQWGRDFAIVISNDAVHYGDEGWGGKNFARYGADSSGYTMALEHEKKIVGTLSGKPTPEKIKKFCDYTVEKNDHKQYKWTWCGRYSVPFGLLTSFYLNEPARQKELLGIPIGYATSIKNKPLKVHDLQMGTTAPATIRHWVGYAAIGYY